MKVISSTPDRLTMGKTNLLGGLICLAMTPLTGFLGVMMILDEPPAFGWALVALSIAMVILSILAMQSKVRVVLDRPEDFVRVSKISPWRRTHTEVPLSSTAGVALIHAVGPGSTNIEVAMVPADGVDQPNFRVGYYASEGPADAQAGHIREWLGQTQPKV
ncbi:hypothetical protein K3728_03545 [Rhodobacteraceae bacterium M385]|nr:hypothetical protein K3728_03545 [Rhodobacteraceae bacterium M385]